MLNTSQTYKDIVAADNHWFVIKLVIDEVGTFTETDLVSIETSGEVVGTKPEIGIAASGEVQLTMMDPTTAIPRMGVLRPYFKAVGMLPQSTTAAIENDYLALTDAEITDNYLVPDEDDSGAYVADDYLCFAATVEVETESEWLPKGVYFVDTRKYSTYGSESVVTIHGYDAMLKFEQEYPSTNHAWPYLDADVVAEMAQTVGVTVDQRTYDVMTSQYMVNLPTGYTMRETLEHIAASYCGNFCISPEGKLLLVPLIGFEPDITGNYLADEDGNAIVFGSEGWCILV